MSRDQPLLKNGAANKEAGRAYTLVSVGLPEKDQAVAPETFTFALREDRLRAQRQREGRYLLRTNLPAGNPAELWKHYILFTEVEQAFKDLKGDPAIRPIYHQCDRRIEAHIFVAFMAYCLQVTLKLTPEDERRRSLTVDLVGALAGILSMATAEKTGRGGKRIGRCERPAAARSPGFLINRTAIKDGCGERI